MLGLAALTTLPSVSSANVGATFEETISTLQQAKKILTPVRRWACDANTRLVEKSHIDHIA